MASTGQQSEHDDFFRYTSGRWLWNEQARLDERYHRFNVAALQQIGAASVGAIRCKSMVKVAEGGFNRIFRLTMDNDATVIARIPSRETGPRSLTVASEVATMDFVSTTLNVPVPKVLSWSAIADNPVESEYMIMEEASGTPLGDTWGSMEITVKRKIVLQLVSLVSRLLSVSFSRYGNIYYSADRIEGCEPAKLTGPLEPDIKADAEKRFAIGPSADEAFWNGERAKMSGVQGPWSTPGELLRAIATRELAWLSNHADATTRLSGPFEAASQSSPRNHIALYQKFAAAADRLLPEDPELVKSTLWHWDLRASNIFVTGDKITSIIDWQDCWAGPLLLQTRRPQLVEYSGDIVLRLPPEYASLDEGPEKQQIRSTVEKSILLFTYEEEVQRQNPVLDRMFRLPHANTIRDAILFATNTWDADIIPFRECLVRIYRHWSDICPAHPCPFTFSEAELATHRQEGEGWNESADFWSSISELVGRDGYVATEDYDEAWEMFASLREQSLKVLKGEERQCFEAATAWAARK